MYFSNFPYRYYTLDNGKSFQLITDILKRVDIRAEVKNNASAFIDYTVDDGETPETIAHKLYGDSKYVWIVFHMNDIVNPYYDWPLTSTALIAYTKKKYGNANLTAIHHHEDRDGNWVNPGALTTPKTNLDYETQLNEKKRNIKLLLPSFVPDVQIEFEKMLKQV